MSKFNLPLLALVTLMFIGLALPDQNLSAQTYSLPNVNTGCPANCRVIPWQAGSDLWNGGTLPVYSQVTCTPLHEDGTTDDTADVNACISAANAGTGSYATCHAAGGCAVYLPAGNVMIKGSVVLKSNVVLRGAGPTTVVTEGASTAQITTSNFSHSTNLNPPTSYQAFPSTFLLSGTPQKGDTSVTCSTGCSNVSVGTWVKIFGNDDPSIISDSMSDSGSYYKCDMCSDNDGYYLMQQYEQVTACSGCGSAGAVWTLSRPLYYPPFTASVTVYNTSGSPQVEPAGAKFNVIQFQTTKAGLEYLQVNATADLGANQNILYQGCLYCWVKGVEVVLSGSNQLSAMFESDWGYGGEIRDSYFHDQRSGASGAGYGIYFQFPNGDMKVENNIVRHSRHPIIFQGGGSGVAILYNYTDDPYTDDLTYLGSARTDHGAHPYMTLWEGNVMSHLTADDCWGSSSHNVMFRNWFWGDETMNWSNLPSGAAPTASGTNPNNGFDAIDVYTGSTYYSFVGNVLGHASLHTTWSGATLRTNNAYGSRANPVVYSYAGAAGTGQGTCDDIIDSTIPSSNTTSLNHGNWDYLTNGVAYWEGGSNHSLVNSMYYPNEPGFLSGYPWPLEGPEGNPTINANAAENCYLNGPAAGVAFNPASCYSSGTTQVRPAPPTNTNGTATPK
jgi:pectate lyase-like protein